MFEHGPRELRILGRRILDVLAPDPGEQAERAALLCAWHHHRAHDDRYLHSLLPNGDVRFHRRG